MLNKIDLNLLKRIKGSHSAKELEVSASKLKKLEQSGLVQGVEFEGENSSTEVFYRRTPKGDAIIKAVERQRRFF